MRKSFAITITAEHTANVDNNTTAMLKTDLKVILDATDAIDASHLGLILLAKQFELDLSSFTVTDMEVYEQ